MRTSGQVRWGLTLVVVAMLAGALGVAHPSSATSEFRQVTVMGQPDSQGTSPSAATMNLPSDVFVDEAGRIFVADRLNHRVLIWTSLPAASGIPPNFILGQADGTGNLPNRGGYPTHSTLRCPSGVWSGSVDGIPRVVVADTGNHRVLVWNDPWIQMRNGAPADLVLGQHNMFSGGNVSRDPCSPSSDGPTDSRVRAPTGVASDGSRLFVADPASNRVLVWSAWPDENAGHADLVLGQPSMETLMPNRGGRAGAGTLSAPFGVGVDQERLFVADTGNHRVLIWNKVPRPGEVGYGNGPPADVVIGQRAMSDQCANAAPCNNLAATDAGAGAPSERTFHAPHRVSVSGGRMSVADTGNNRVLIFKSLPSIDTDDQTFAASADAEIGHGRFTGGFPESLNGPRGVHWSPSLKDPLTGARGRILVADSGNNRILVFVSPLMGLSASVSAAAKLGSLQITISWDQVPEASGYRLYRDGFWFDDLPPTSSSTTPGYVCPLPGTLPAKCAYTDSLLSPDTYTYSVSPLTDSNRIEGVSVGAASATADGNLPPIDLQPKSSYSSYLAEGDSVTSVNIGSSIEAYPLQLANYLAWYQGAASPNTTFVGTPGAKCEHVRGRIGNDLFTSQADLVTVMIGLNDILAGYRNTIGRTSMVSYRNCIRDVVAAVRNDPKRTLLLLNVSHMTNWDMMHPTKFHSPDVSVAAGSEEKKRAWNKVIRDVAAHAGVPLVGVTEAMDQAFSECGPACVETFLTPDNIHPNQAGHDVMSDAVLEQLLKYYSLGLTGPTRPGRPTPPEALYKVDETAQVNLSWKVSSGAIRYELNFSKDARFAVGVSPSIFVDTSATAIELGSGRWYMRVRGLDGSGGTGVWSLPGRVIVDTRSPTTTGIPAAGFAFRGTHTPRWSWRASNDFGESGVSHYEVCWRRNDVLHQTQPGDCPNRTNTALDNVSVRLGPGIWYLRVRAFDRAGRASEWSEEGSWISAGTV